MFICVQTRHNNLKRHYHYVSQLFESLGAIGLINKFNILARVKS